MHNFHGYSTFAIHWNKGAMTFGGKARGEWVKRILVNRDLFPTFRYWPFFAMKANIKRQMFQIMGVTSGCVKANRGNPLFLPVTSAHAVQTVCMQIFEQHLCFLLLMSSRKIYLTDEQSVLCYSENLLSHGMPL